MTLHDGKPAQMPPGAACPTCGVAVRQVVPMIEPAPEAYRFGPALVQGDDRVASYRLEPCAHEVAGYEMTIAVRFLP